ncbi:hypothetical protein CKM354_000517500 [Cercospora kikuchii]|uniref:Uncharacterized protein n=1 Tax=Cercospora kikuchii TaxID=84275 RepID=A0A9P3CI96_9PEZI|nr:uncharacterized protein CKM354_000517500 [Cercospora kikuchii]GIZ41887.1 hypothetical protein CKM354_000517500 [Cercospora kikuchii]
MGVPRSVLLAAAILSTTTALPGLLCKTQSQPNPIAKDRPTEVTGTINGTSAIVPIPYDVARSVVPAQYGILREAYEKLIPGFPKDMYPAEFEGLLDHDVQSFGIKIPDFQRMALRFPFVDRLNDGYSCFRYTAPQLVSVSNPVAIAGSTAYGKTIPATFDPPCDGYANDKTASTYLSGYAVPESKLLGSEPTFDSHFRSVASIPYSQKLLVNITNQPSFGSGLPVCDNYITLYNTSVTQGRFAPVPVQGELKVEPPYYPHKTTLKAWGYRMDNAFIEKNNVPCESLKGYGGTGLGDSG